MTLSEMVLAGGPVRPPASASYAETEWNDEFDAANLVNLVDGVELAGAIAEGTQPFDRDVYELGPADAGDRILATLDLQFGNDVQVGLFDDQNRLVGYTNPSSPTSGPGQVDIVLREATERLYAVVATRSSSLQARHYAARVAVQPDAGIPGNRPQILVLDFQGGDDIKIGNRRPIDVPPFDAANIGPVFAGQTEDMIRYIMEIVEEDYAGLDVEIYRGGDANIPDGERTTIYFGTYDDQLLGLADNIDPFNADSSQSAVIYTDTFALFLTLSTNVEAMGQALGNVASHEAGHLLGLRHTADADGIMDITASARRMMLDQWFSVSALHDSVMSIGYQDAPSMLAWTLGGTAPPPPARRLATLKRAAEIADDPNDFYIPRSWLGTCSCKDCDKQHDHAGDEMP